MNEEQLVLLGMYVERIMRDEEFGYITQEFQKQCFNHWLITEPHELKKREMHFAQLQGANDFLMHMKSFVDTKNQIQAKYDAPSQEDAQQDIDP